MNNRTVRALVAGISLSVSIGANAGLWVYNDVMSGLQDVPPNASPASGITKGTYDDVTRILHVDCDVTGLISVTTNAHIHTGAFGTNGGVTLPFSGPFGSTSYHYTNNFVLTVAQGADFLAHKMYSNVHTQSFPGGEVRSQLNPIAVPEPTTMLALALGSVVLLRRRSR